MSEPKPWIVHADPDKPHRCPNCWLVSGYVPWKIMTCCNCNEPGCPGGCGQRYASRPWLPYYSQEQGHPVKYTFWKAKEALWAFKLDKGIYGCTSAFRNLLVPRTVDWLRTQHHLRKIRRDDGRL